MWNVTEDDRRRMMVDKKVPALSCPQVKVRYYTLAERCLRWFRYQ